MQIKAVHDLRAMGIYGFYTESKALSDIPCRATTCNQTQDFCLPGRQYRTAATALAWPAFDDSGLNNGLGNART